jgi:hypothetical protein
LWNWKSILQIPVSGKQWVTRKNRALQYFLLCTVHFFKEIPMDPLSQISNTIALSMGAAWASGINLYATILTLGFMGVSGNIILPEKLQILTHPAVMGGAGIMFAAEFFADKIPGLDSTWDALHTFIRIPAGAMMAAGAVGEVNPALMLAAGIVGGGITAGTHVAKAGTRALINTSPEPFSNWAASFSEDIAVIAGIWVALQHPWIFIALFAVFILLMIWLLPKLWRLIQQVFGAIGRFFTKKPAGPSTPSES